jgi:hypothetical protein
MVEHGDLVVEELAEDPWASVHRHRSTAFIVLWELRRMMQAQIGLESEGLLCNPGDWV